MMSGPRLGAVIGAGVGATVKGAYLPWGEVRYREPPAGLSLEEWWVGIRLARMGGFQHLPLVDKGGAAFVFARPEEVLIHLHHIDQDAAGVIRAGQEVASAAQQEFAIPAQRSEYLLRSLIEESITSSQLEGASTTRKVAEAMLREGRNPRNHSERMIYNNYLTMRAIQGFRDEPITPKRILEIHRRVTEGTLENPAEAGRLRHSDDYRIVDNENGIALHTPPAFSELPDRLQRLCDFANAPESDRPFVHPILRAILLHFMIGYDHPFTDGNGRTARALFYWSMLRSGYWLTEFISISQILKKAPAQYGRAYLFTESDGGDTTYFLLHQLETIRKAIDSLHSYLAKRRTEQRAVEQLIAPSSRLGGELNHRQRALLAHALKHPGEIYKISIHQKTHGVVYQTARTDLMALATLGLLDEGRTGKMKIFLAPADLKQRIEKLKGERAGS